MFWRFASYLLEIEPTRPLILGILNVTPDSFHDGGRYTSLETALKHAENLLTEGTDLIDIGGESTRPGAAAIDIDEEKRRVIPVIEKIHEKWPHAILSIDTYKAEVAKEALNAGASIINDVGAGRWSEGMFELLAGSSCGYITMHSLGKPQKMQINPSYQNVVDEVFDFLNDRLETLSKYGIQKERVLCDAGIGFGKRLEDNLNLIAHAAELTQKLKRPMVWGISHKSWISHLLNVAQDERLVGTLAGLSWLLSQKIPMIWRVHDAKAARQLMDVWQAFKLKKQE